LNETQNHLTSAGSLRLNKALDGTGRASLVSAGVHLRVPQYVPYRFFGNSFMVRYDRVAATSRVTLAAHVRASRVTNREGPSFIP